MSMNFFRMLENQQASYLSQHPSVVDMTISKSASGYTNHYLPRTSEIPKSLESTTPKTPTHEPSYPRLAESSRLDPRSESRLDEKAMAENRNLDNIIPPRSSDRDLDRTLERGGLDSPSLQWARNMLQAHQQLSDIKSSANHVAHGHNMTTPHLQNGTNSNGPPTMVPTNRLQVDLSCTPNINSFSPPTSLSNNGQLVVPHPLKPVKTRKSYQCKMCDQKFESKSLVYYHGKEAHGLQDKTHPCMHCYKSFSSPSQLHQHTLVHTGERKYHCKFCSKSFKQLSHLQQHTRIHTGEKPYKCTIPNCNKAFAQLSNLQHHQRNHDNNKNKSSRKSFYCTVCQRGFVTESSLDKHITRLHSHMSHHSNSALRAQACAMIPGLSTPQMPKLESPLSQHNQGLFAHTLGLHNNVGLTSPNPMPSRPMTANSMSAIDEQGLDLMAPLRQQQDESSPLQLSMSRNQHQFFNTNLPPISQVSNRWPFATGIPAAAALAAGLRASLSRFDYGTHRMAASQLASMSTMGSMGMPNMGGQMGGMGTHGLSMGQMSSMAPMGMGMGTMGMGMNPGSMNREMSRELSREISRESVESRESMGRESMGNRDMTRESLVGREAMGNRDSDLMGNRMAMGSRDSMSSREILGMDRDMNRESMESRNALARSHFANRDYGMSGPRDPLGNRELGSIGNRDLGMSMSREAAINRDIMRGRDMMHRETPMSPPGTQN